MFNVPLLSILGVHEMGHYTAARHHRVDVTPPYFIPFLPFPPPAPGTMGAIIKLKSPFPDRNSLMDLGAAGPLAGALVAIPVLVAGLALSEVRRSTGGVGLELGESILFKLLSKAVLGDIPAGYDVALHPVAYAGWLGLFITMLNLIPAGQLDGGHIAYALFGDRFSGVARLVPYALLLMGLAWTGWYIWAAFLLFLGTRHPKPLFDNMPLTRGRVFLGICSALLYILCFTLNPFRMLGG